MKAKFNDSLRKSIKDSSKLIPPKKPELKTKNNANLPTPLLKSNRIIKKMINKKLNTKSFSKNVFNNTKKIVNDENSKISKKKHQSISLINPQTFYTNCTTFSKPFYIHQKIIVNNNNPKNKKINNSNSLNNGTCPLITRKKSDKKLDAIPTTSSTVGAISHEYKGEHYTESEKVSPKNNNTFINNFNYESGSEEKNIFFCKFNDYSSLTFGNSRSNSSSHNNKSSSKKYLADSIMNNLSKLKEENEALKKELKATNDEIKFLKYKIEELQETKESKKNIFESRLSCKINGAKKFKENKKYLRGGINKTHDASKSNNKLNNNIIKKKITRKGNNNIRKSEKIANESKKKKSISGCYNGDTIKEYISKLKI